MALITPPPTQEEYSHPSLTASLEDFENNARFSESNSSPGFRIPSCHSGFYQSDDGDSDLPESDSGGAWSPPGDARYNARMAGRELEAAPRHGQAYAPPARMRFRGSRPARSSRESSPQYEDAVEGDTTLPVHARSPTESPIKPSPSPSAQVFPEGDREFGRSFGGGDGVRSAPVGSENPNNCTLLPDQTRTSCPSLTGSPQSSDSPCEPRSSIAPSPSRRPLPTFDGNSTASPSLAARPRRRR